MIVETAAKINAMEFFTIIFSTAVGSNVFKSFRHEELLLEEVARENGHEELACFLEQRHSMYVCILAFIYLFLNYVSLFLFTVYLLWQI